jgi:hypothetical protein
LPRSTLGGDDPDHDLSDEEKDARERELRKQARECLAKGEAKQCKQILNRARNISRRPSQRAGHH